MMMFHLHNAADSTTGVRHRVNHIVGMEDASIPTHPKHFSRLPVFPDVQSGNYTLAMAGVYEIISEYYNVWRTEEDCYEIPCKRVYAYYTYDGGETLQEVLLDAVPGILGATPFYRAVEHLDGATGTCWREV